jgi:hypothetical protein
MYVTATFPVAGDSHGARVEHVPLSAVILMDGKRHVFVQDADSSFTRKEVKVMSEQAGRASITGLAPGQRVVTEGNLYLQQILSRNGDPGGRGAPAGTPAEGGK